MTQPFMNKWFIALLSTVLMLATQQGFCCPLQKLTYITEDYPPHNFVENDTLQGISIDLLLKALSAINCSIKKSDIKVMPWTRGYYMALNQPNIVLFATSRIKSREKLFKWACTIINTQVALISRKDSQISINNVEEINQLTIGVVKDDVAEKLIHRLNVKPTNLKYGNNHPETLAKMLVLHRFDVWAYDEIVAFWILSRLGYNTSDFETIYSFQPVNNCYAFSNSTPNSTVNILQRAINDIKEKVNSSGQTVLEEIQMKYGLNID